ncbi:MAG: PEGA domain-containing protein [Candidatus Omnitrophota bacterium]|jgi:hypothetical protein
MHDDIYLILRKIFFWFFLLLFLVSTPIILYYSLGYKFDIDSKKFLKTGAISIKTFPKGINVYLDGTKINETTPCTLRDLLPKEYTLILVRDGFYPYEMKVEVRPSQIQDIDIFIVPRMVDITKLDIDLQIYKFFVAKHLFGETIIVFTDKGIYFLDGDFKGAKKVSSQIFEEGIANSIENLKESNSRFLFWNKNNLWMLDVSQGKDKDGKYPDAVLLYKTEEDIKDVFFGFRGKYIIIHDGLKVIALDADNIRVSFPVYELKSVRSKIFYDSRSETIYIQDKVQGVKGFSLFRAEIMPLVNERILNERK